MNGLKKNDFLVFNIYGDSSILFKDGCSLCFIMIKAVPSRKTTLTIPLMVLQPYSKAVKSARRSSSLFSPEVSVPPPKKENRMGGRLLKKTEKRGGVFFNGKKRCQ